MDKLWEKVALVLATGFGLGWSPVAPGTVGSLAGPPLVWAWQQLELPFAVNLLASIALAVVGIPICARAARTLGIYDPAAVVYDEIVSFTLVFLTVDVDLTTGLIGFLWFRLFDIVKPGPIQRLDRLPGGLGIMADDLTAGACAGVALHATVQLFQIEATTTPLTDLVGVVIPF